MSAPRPDESTPEQPGSVILTCLYPDPASLPVIRVDRADRWTGITAGLLRLVEGQAYARPFYGWLEGGRNASFVDGVFVLHTVDGDVAYRLRDQVVPGWTYPEPCYLAELVRDDRRCCSLHRPVGCCDPDDCGPCCENCPTCPARAQQPAAVPA